MAVAIGRQSVYSLGGLRAKALKALLIGLIDLDTYNISGAANNGAGFGNIKGFSAIILILGNFLKKL